MRVIVAPDSFKGSSSAAAATAAIAAGWRSVRPGDEVLEMPMADGGEGTLDVLAAAVPGCRWHAALVSGPGQQRVQAAWLELPGQLHVVEFASAAGLTLLSPPQPLRSHSYGVGELIGHALDAGARSIVIGLGGSASTDGGTGALAALGARFLDASGADLPPGGGALSGLARISLAGLRPPPAGGAQCLTDVRAPLLGRDGAAMVYGPQKGASPSDVANLEHGLSRLSALAGGRPDELGSGAAGGAGYGFAIWGARLCPGAAHIADIAGLPDALAGADLVITGEGRYDRTSRTGKAVGTVLDLAAEAGAPAVIVAGVLATIPRLPAIELAALAGDQSAAVADAGRWLEQAGRQLAVAQSEAAQSQAAQSQAAQSQAAQSQAAQSQAAQAPREPAGRHAHGRRRSGP
jgi:glycerate 2-kinase